jgi:hypothetical protein
MGGLQTELGLVKEKFSRESFIVEELYRRDADFKSLCSDYFLCTNLMQEIRIELEERQLAIKEYQDTCTDLENELKNWILKSK